MKKNYLSILACFVLAVSNAQLKENGVIEITPKIGYSSFAEITNNTGNNGSQNTTGTTGSITGLSTGATIDYYFNNRWSLRSGLLFEKMGATSVIFNSTYQDKLNYISIPINANWHFGSTRKWNLNFGLSPSFLTSSEFTKNNIIDKNVPNNVVNSFQIGLSFGIGYKIEINKKFGIIIENQGFSGFTNIFNYNNLNAKNSGSSLNIGAVIQL